MWTKSDEHLPSWEPRYAYVAPLAELGSAPKISCSLGWDLEHTDNVAVGDFLRPTFNTDAFGRKKLEASELTRLWKGFKM